MKSCISFFHEGHYIDCNFSKNKYFLMKSKAFEAYASCGYFAPKNSKMSSVVKQLSSKNHGVGVKLLDTV